MICMCMWGLQIQGIHSCLTPLIRQPSQEYLLMTTLLWVVVLLVVPLLPPSPRTSLSYSWSVEVKKYHSLTSWDPCWACSGFKFDLICSDCSWIPFFNAFLQTKVRMIPFACCLKFGSVLDLDPIQGFVFQFCDIENLPKILFPKLSKVSWNHSGKPNNPYFSQIFWVEKMFQENRKGLIPCLYWGVTLYIFWEPVSLGISVCFFLNFLRLN